MERDIRALMENDRFAGYIGATLVNVKPGYALAALDISENHLNGVNIIQGGVIFTLADFAFAAAANAGGQTTVAINSSIVYYKASKGKRLIAEAKECSSSSKIANYQVEVFNEHRESIAHLSITGYKKV